ncbi:MAG: nitrogen regulation protein NR(II) [Candidatus Methylacidiphilales bacterium]
MKSSFLGKVVERAEHMSRDELLRYFARMARENGLLETVFGALRDGIVVMDRQGVIRYLNPGARRLLPFPEEIPERALIGHYLKEMDWSALLSRDHAVSRVLEIDYPDHRILDLHMLPVDLPGLEANQETVKAFACIFHDVTAQHSQTREAIETERVQAVTMLAAGVAHELGNPINNLNIHLQLMQRELRKLPEKVRVKVDESIHVAREEIRRLDSIIHEFLQAIRPTVPQLKPVKLERLISETARLLEREIRNQNILLELDMDPDLPEVPGDEGQLKQVFYNLIKNALQAMAEKGILSVQGRREERWVVLVFRDNGEGIALEDIPQVMQPFYTTKKRGSGLGLMIVQRIVREHGGRIEIESHRGQGTTVRLRLPWKGAQVKFLGEGTPAK